MLPAVQGQSSTVEQAHKTADAECHGRIAQMRQLEEENNRIFIESYGIHDDLSPEVSDDHIALHFPDREEDIKRLISYAIGCMMGRYRLDRPGLIYAHSGNRDFQAIYYGATEEHGLNTD
jgi:hypothetical protein